MMKANNIDSQPSRQLSVLNNGGYGDTDTANAIRPLNAIGEGRA